MRKRYDEQLKQLNDEMTAMGELCKIAITYAVTSLKNQKQEIREKITDIENEINQKERFIEQHCMKLLLQQQPVASDLRMISAALKMISDMERIGDQAFDISQIKVSMDKESKAEKHIYAMAKSAVSMVNDSVESFVSHDLMLAHSVIAEDDKVDHYFEKIKEDLIWAIKEESESGSALLDMLMIAKYLERIGDHATNIAEWVEYSITGRYKQLDIKSS